MKGPWCVNGVHCVQGRANRRGEQRRQQNEGVQTVDRGRTSRHATRRSATCRCECEDDDAAADTYDSDADDAAYGGDEL